MEMNWFLLGIIYLNLRKLVIWQKFHISELVKFLNIKIKHTLLRNSDNRKSICKESASPLKYLFSTTSPLRFLLLTLLGILLEIFNYKSSYYIWLSFFLFLSVESYYTDSSLTFCFLLKILYWSSHINT